MSRASHPSKAQSTKSNRAPFEWSLRRVPFAGWLWILSGLPVGLALMVSPPSLWIVFFTFVVFLEVGHALSPIVLAWTHRGYRRLIFKYPARYILLPGGFFLAALAIGAATSLGWTSFVRPAQDLTGQSYAFTDLRNPFGMMVAVYFWWNVYHFGMQNFGVLSMCRTGQRAGSGRGMIPVGRWQVRRPRLSAVLCIAVTAFGMVILPKIMRSSELGIAFYSMIFVNHWIVAIGLPSRIYYQEGAKQVFGVVALMSRPWVRAWAFVVGVLLLGGIGFVWSAPAWVWRAWGYSIPAREPDYIVINHVIPVVLSLRFGLSFMHFLYDRNIWKMSDPEIRAIVGPAFGVRSAALAVASNRPRLRSVA